MERAARSGIGVFGAGYVGLVTAACLAELGRNVVLHDVDVRKIATLRTGVLPIHEPGLLELLHRGVAAGRLRFTTEAQEAVAGRAAIFVAVGTPTCADGRADLSFVREAAGLIARHLDGPTVIVNKSTVPIETGDLVEAIVRAERIGRHDAVVVANPEFLREGSAISDFFHPDRIVLGCEDPQAEALLRELYAPLDVPLLVTDVHTAEMIKYTANAFLATKISFANEIAAICERVGVDVKTVVAGAGADRRIGTAFLGAGLGFGGSCLPKDVNALRQIAEEAAVEPLLLNAVADVNARQIERICARIAYLLDGLAHRRVGVLGLAFKAQTDDVRDSPALALVETLLAHGACVTVHDPVAADNALARLGDRVAYAPVDDYHRVAEGADALVLATDWNAYRDIDLNRLRTTMRRRIVIDARNFYEPLRFVRGGFHYAGVGRGTHLAALDRLSGRETRAAPHAG
jgi:UDPglucose 6-dehydrogenase